MEPRGFAELADQVAQVLEQHGVSVYHSWERQRLDQTLWEFIHPDLADSLANPYHDCTRHCVLDNCECRTERDCPNACGGGPQ
ncbi:hypothetical protein GCM10009678_04950 [Actinomadura kijaniata]